jgi:formimidoylglutamate deiminase
MAEELRLLEYGQRLVNRSRNLLAGETVQSTGRHIFERALAGGAMALGRRGGLAVGAPADLVTLDARSAALEGRRDDQIVDTLIFGASQRLIADVWRGGEQVVSSGRHGRRDEIERAYRAAITAVMPP